MPVERLENGNWPHPARLPLGGGWRGHCTAPGHEGELPAQNVLEAFCNLGYAEGCMWSPPDRAWDAVRFAPLPVQASAARQTERTSDLAPRVLHLHYVCERNHRPVEDGRLQFDLSQMIWVLGHKDSRVQKMAECFLESYLKKKS
jgi:hypothetical protein